jgi:hypothetical protein
MKTVLVVFLVVAGWAWMGLLQTEPEISPLTAEESSRILQATLRIEIEFTNDQGVIVIKYGLGSHMQLNSEVVIVTHNHWEAALTYQSRVRILTGDHRLLTTLNGQQFVEATLLEDPGTRIFLAPGEITKDLTPLPVDLNTTQQAGQIKPGTMVRAIHCLNDEQRSMVITTLVVEAITSNDGTPAIRLRNLDKQFIRPGDSGGGIWADGRLVGNMWTAEKIVDENHHHQSCVAALMP